MRGLIAPIAQPRTTGIPAELERLLGLGAIADCQRCGEPMVVVSEERIAAYSPVFDVGCRCTGCGLISHLRQGFDQIDQAAPERIGRADPGVVGHLSEACVPPPGKQIPLDRAVPDLVFLKSTFRYR